MKSTKLAMVVLALALVLYFVWSFFRTPSYTNLPPATNGPWIAFGDSLTAGLGAENGQDYPTLLSGILGIPIKNFGRSGDTSENGLERLAEVEKENPSVVLLCFGGNDTLRSISHETTFNNLSTMIDRFQAKGIFVVVIGVRSASVFDKYETQFSTLAESKNTFYIPNILAGILGSPSLMSDQLHPNEAGYKAIAERFAAALEPVLPKLSKSN
jgi:lysophospholipase L1-like esterase